MVTAAQLIEKLRIFRERTRETPLFNPVFQLSLELSRGLESGRLSLDDITCIVSELEQSGWRSRAARLRRLIEPSTAASALEFEISREADFKAFAARWSKPAIHAVFTAHPTFLLAPAESDLVAREAATPNQLGAWPTSYDQNAVTLDAEHDRAMSALAHAQDARDAIVRRLLIHARANWPERWGELRPLPFRFATWVGYDMDGRTDIGWQTSVRFRLAEKSERLTRYANALSEANPGHPLIALLGKAADFTTARAKDFEADLDDPATLSQAANRLTADHPQKLTSLHQLIEELDPPEGAGPPADVELRTIAAAMRADGLGMGWVHFRVNASQLHNAVRRWLPGERELDRGSQRAVAALRELIDGAQPLRSNFASLALESSTAIRQFLLMAQILRDIDADTPIRLLIAECEQPSTVLAALYLAKLFGIEDKVDISPLFETEAALEHGGRMLDGLLTEPAYRAYVRSRGRLAIQTGFSDAGRFLGQIPASLAIERLQGRLAAAMEANGLRDVAALVFNTHGESMGRGAHPSSFIDRREWPLSPWARDRFTRARITLEPEASFQGGDGYLFFATPALALATLSRLLERPDEATAPDLLYERTDLSLDFYRSIKEHQQRHLESQTYNRAITAFGLGMLSPTGSRLSRRQSDLSADRTMTLRQIRAIPHNAILQQLGYPVNVIGGMGSASDENLEDLAALLSESRRGRQMIRLVRAALDLSSVKTVAAYGELFNSAYWASRTYRGMEDHLATACAKLADYLIQDDRNGVFRRLASRLRTDELKLRRLLAMLPNDATWSDGEQARREIGVLHAIRLSLLQHMFLKAVALPAFSRTNDIGRTDVLEMVFTLRVEDALEQLRRAFPTQSAKLSDYTVEQEADYPDDDSSGYGAIHETYIGPIAAAHALNLRVSATIANHFGAHG